MCLAKDCLFVDDSVKNLRAAAEMGIKTCRFVRQPYDDDFTPDFEVSGFAELPRLLVELEG